MLEISINTTFDTCHRNISILLQNIFLFALSLDVKIMKMTKN